MSERHSERERGRERPRVSTTDDEGKESTRARKLMAQQRPHLPPFASILLALRRWILCLHGHTERCVHLGRYYGIYRTHMSTMYHVRRMVQVSYYVNSSVCEKFSRQ